MGTMSEAEGNAPAPVAVITPGDPMTIESAVRDVLKTAQYCDGLSRGLNEAVRALEKRDALVCILSESCDEANYVRLIEALSVEHQIPLLKIGDNKLLGEWAGLCKHDREGNARKVVGCSCVVVRQIEEATPAWEFLKSHLQSH